MSLSSYITSFQASPIILVGGAAGTGKLPLSVLLNTKSYPAGVTSSPAGNGGFFGQFRVLTGHSLMDTEVVTYPVANQTVAANAVIANPLRVSLEMLVPADAANNLTDKLLIMTALKSKLDKHTALGGWYDVATPGFLYQGCLLTSLIDASEEDAGQQPQVRWIWNFMQPLLTVQAAQAAQAQAMARISRQHKNAGDPPGSDPISTDLSNPDANITQNVVPAASNPLGSNVTRNNPTGSTVSVQSVSPITPGNIA